MSAKAVPVLAPLATRAVERAIDPGEGSDDNHCPHLACALDKTLIKFHPPQRHTARQVIANVYEDGRWVRVEHWHGVCYLAAGEPYGPPAPMGKPSMPPRFAAAPQRP